MPSEPGGGQPMSQRRQVTIDALCDHFANDVMTMEEFERRVEQAHKAESAADLKALLRDLPGGDLPAATDGTPARAPAPRREFSVTAAAHVKDKEFVLACLGGATRKGRWKAARTNYAVAVLGGTELDFREAILGPGVTEVRVVAVCGGVDIIVPPGLNVESHGLAVMGGFDAFGDDEVGDPEDPDAPRLRITGVACMGGVDVTMRYPGETAREAKRRRRAERKGRRRRLGRGE